MGDYNPRVIAYIETQVRTCRNPELPFMSIGDRSYNLPQVLEEIKSKTPQGREFYSAFANLYKIDSSKSKKLKKSR